MSTALTPEEQEFCARINREYYAIAEVDRHPHNPEFMAIVNEFNAFLLKKQAE